MNEDIYRLINPKGLIENWIDGVIIGNVKGEILSVNKAFEKMSGFNRDEVVGKNAIDLLVSKVSRKDALGLLSGLVLSGSVSGKELVTLKKDGSEIISQISASIYKGVNLSPVIVLLARDITQQKKLEEDLKLFRQLLDKTNDSIVVVDPVSSSITDCNQKIIEELGYSKEELKKLTIVDIDNKIRNIDDWQKFGDVIKSKGSLLFEGEARRKDGSSFPAEINATLSTTGDKHYLVAIVRNITQRKKDEKRILELNEVLKILNKIMRHDILNDLSVAGGNIDIYLEYGEPKNVRELLGTVVESVSRSEELITKMRDLEKAVSSGQPLGEVDVGEVVEKTKEEFNNLEINLSSDAEVMVDAAFSSVLTNLFRNAKDHGKATKIDITVNKTKDLVEIRVADNGKGISDSIKPLLFEEGAKFGETGNTGLGLYIIRKTVERYGGSVSVEDNKPKGVVFILRIPKAM